MKDYFKTLDLNEGASEEDIRRAYKKLAMQHHPDRGGDAGQFQEIQEAYSTLTDPERRAQWEQQRAFSSAGPGNFGFSFNFGPDINDIFGQFGGHPFFGQGFRNQPKNRDLRVAIDLDLASTLNEQVKHIDIRGQDGQKRTIQVNIPKGVHSNMQMRFPGHGENHVRGIPAGDLYVEFRVHIPHGYSIDQLNITKKVSINAIDAMIGSRIDVAGIDGKTFDIMIPPATQSGTTFRIPQQGIWDVNHPVRGDLLIEITLEVPKTISADQFDKLKTLVK